MATPPSAAHHQPPPAPPGAVPALRWDIFCRVVDNFGDIGVCWRLAADLASRGDVVRLVVDDASALGWMAPGHEHRVPGVTVMPWPGPREPADIVVEAFGCDLPEPYLMAMRGADPVWINLEYLSAEDYVERSHGLPSPRSDGLRKWFFYPGFTARTGGLLREAGLMERRAGFDRQGWLARLGLRLAPGERLASLFCYDNAAIGELLRSLAAAPTLLLLTPGPAQRQVQQAQAVQAGQMAQEALVTQELPGRPAALRTAPLPFLSQTDFDHLLWACDLNIVRGEDSLVRALWAGSPFLWQAYPQPDGAHAAKVRALLAQLALPDAAASAWLAWNGMAPWPGLPELEPWRRATEAARARLLALDDLATQLRRFAAARRC